MKIATGSGTTTVMGMLIAWQALNRANARDGRTFSDALLVVAPGITIRDRLRVLLPSDPANVYAERDLVPPHLRAGLARAQVVVTNFRAFGLRETREGVEVSGAARRDKAIKLDTARNWWIPSVEAHGGFVRWRLVEVTDPWNCRSDLRAALAPGPAVPA